ncbi:hypothetical protein [Peribacillus butanolivorans]|uniref:hypothetical protein n=1 Tax=Peribacillus butanolivorans TaxID=421767 RepID=UPI0035D64A63
MKKYGLLFMAGIYLVVLIFGHLHWKNMSQAAGIEDKKAEERIKEKEKEDREALIQSLKPAVTIRLPALQIAYTR